MDVPNGPPAVWAAIEDGFYAATRGGDFLGCVDRLAPDVFEASDSRSREVGRFATLRAAMDAVAAASDSDPRRRAGGK